MNNDNQNDACERRGRRFPLGTAYSGPSEALRSRRLLNALEQFPEPPECSDLKELNMRLSKHVFDEPPDRPTTRGRKATNRGETYATAPRVS